MQLFSHVLQQSFRRYPALKDRFNSVVINFFKQAMTPTMKLVSDMVAYVPTLSTSVKNFVLKIVASMQACYVNTTHPDFIGGHKVSQVITISCY